MGKCEECGAEIRYNKFKRYRGKVLCYDCYDTRLERKKAKALAAEKNVENMDANEEAKKYGYNDALVPVEEPVDEEKSEE